MMRFKPRPEPVEWEKRCRQKGLKWLRDHPGYDRPYNYWTDFEPDLREEFLGLCSYCVMRVMKADMDHFIPVAELKRTGREKFAYEWSNFRYVEGILNQRKGDHALLDPFEVRDDWFEILLPSLQLVLTERVPKKKRAEAEFTSKRLGLQDDEVVIRYRQSWFELYRKGKLTLDGLHEVAPLIALAVERDIRNGRDWKYPATAVE